MYENAVNHRGRMLDPISLEELPQDRITWLVLDNAVYSPASILRYIEDWEESQEIEEEYRLGSATFRNWTRGNSRHMGAYCLANPLRTGVPWSRTALRCIYDRLS